MVLSLCPKTCSGGPALTQPMDSPSHYLQHQVAAPTPRVNGPPLTLLLLSLRLETRVRVSGVPVTSHPEELDNLLQSVGEVAKSEKYESRDGQTQVCG